VRESERDREESKRALAEVVARLQDLEEAAQAESRSLAKGSATRDASRDL